MLPPQNVVDSIKKRYPDEADDILRELKYDTSMRCWYFWLHDIYHGVEEDGYIHT